ncbi:hypothetical protein GIB67_043241 [Kingdonia uniflora]|uniref:Uncharacterized protein n=1 Tax=Kingdonia uniflora TaxID=39325 RepID=A0A7J7L2R3_9MAGN|nr:hypothetical protein GIB67_043241 [Kingdonia uniflora]
MGPIEVPYQSSESIKIPTSHCEFGADFSPSVDAFWEDFKFLTDGLNARLNCDLITNLALKANAQLTNQCVTYASRNCKLDYKGEDFRA